MLSRFDRRQDAALKAWLGESRGYLGSFMFLLKDGGPLQEENPCQQEISMLRFHAKFQGCRGVDGSDQEDHVVCPEDFLGNL